MTMIISEWASPLQCGWAIIILGRASAPGEGRPIGRSLMGRPLGSWNRLHTPLGLCCHT